MVLLERWGFLMSGVSLYLHLPPTVMKPGLGLRCGVSRKQGGTSGPLSPSGVANPFSSRTGLIAFKSQKVTTLVLNCPRVALLNYLGIAELFRRPQLSAFGTERA